MTTFQAVIRVAKTQEELSWQSDPFQPVASAEEAKAIALGFFNKRLSGLEEDKDFVCTVEPLD